MTMSVNAGPITDFRAFEASPGVGVVLLADKPDFTIVAVSDDFLSMAGSRRKDLVGTGYFQYLARVTQDVQLTAETDLRGSFAHLLENKTPHEIPLQRHDKRCPDGTFATSYWRVRNAPIVDQSGEVAYIIHTLADITDKVKAETRLASVRGIEEANRFFMNAPVIIGYLRGENYVIELANEGLLKVWDKTKDVIGKPLLQAIPELAGQGTKELLDEVCRTGKPFFAYEHPLSFDRNGTLETLYFDFVYQPFYEEDGETIAGVISVGHDVTAQVQAGNKFRNVIDQANDPILILKGNDMVLEVANDALYKLWKIDKSAKGKPFLEIRPEMKDQGYMDLLQKVYSTGESFQGYEMPVMFEDSDGERRTFYFNFTYQPYREPGGEISGVLVMGSDATAQVLAKREVEESYRKWKDLANSMPAIVWSADSDGSIQFLNDRWYEFTGLTKQQSTGFGWISVLHPEDMDRCLEVWKNAIRKRIHYEVEVRFKSKQGDYRWMIARGVPISKEGKVIAWYGTNIDLHEQKQLELLLEDKVRERTQELEAKNKLLDNILQHSSNGISVSEMIFDESGKVIDALTILANDSAVNFTGIPREIYLSKSASQLDPNIMSSHYGQTCLRTLQTGEPSVVQYFLEMASKWLELTISKMDDSHLIHIFTDVTPIKLAQLQLEKSLEDLRYANKNLEEFAYSASHDLKEPIRKIQFFSNRLREDLKGKLNETQMSLFERLESSSVRMQNLIDDLLEYSQAGKGAAEQEEIDLNLKVKKVMEDLELEIQKRQARVTFSSLPTIRGNRRQIQQLFQNLISNSLKYSKDGVPPEINIMSTITTGKDALPGIATEDRDKPFHLIGISDNGIGFHQDDADRIFTVFTRLHSGLLYKGTGIGLSIVKKVVEGHHGYIWAVGEPGKGATFKMLFPAG